MRGVGRQESKAVNILGDLQRQMYEGKITEEVYYEKYYFYRKKEEKSGIAIYRLRQEKNYMVLF